MGAVLAGSSLCPALQVSPPGLQWAVPAPLAQRCLQQGTTPAPPAARFPRAPRGFLERQGKRLIRKLCHTFVHWWYRHLLIQLPREASGLSWLQHGWAGVHWAAGAVLAPVPVLVPVPVLAAGPVRSRTMATSWGGDRWRASSSVCQAISSEPQTRDVIPLSFTPGFVLFQAVHKPGEMVHLVKWCALKPNCLGSGAL